MVETLRTSTALPGAPLTSFFESLSPLQKQLLIQQQFQQIPSTATKDFSQSLPNQRIPVNSGLNFQHSSVWFPVSEDERYFTFKVYLIKTQYFHRNTRQ